MPGVAGTPMSAKPPPLAHKAKARLNAGMAESFGQGRGPRLHLLYLREEELRSGLSLLLTASKDLSHLADPVLDAEGLGQAHHRALMILAAHPGLSVGDLISRLGVTKQSLGRVLDVLKERALLIERKDPDDGRRRRLDLTPEGQDLERRLWEAKRGRLQKAFSAAGPDAVAGFRRVLEEICDGRSRLPSAGGPEPAQREAAPPFAGGDRE